jgi:hypothetical protein
MWKVKTLNLPTQKKLNFSVKKEFQSPTEKKIFRNSSAAQDVVTEEYFEKFFCCIKISFVRARILSLQRNILGLERISAVPEEYLRR